MTLLVCCWVPLTMTSLLRVLDAAVERVILSCVELNRSGSVVAFNAIPPSLREANLPHSPTQRHSTQTHHPKPAVVLFTLTQHDVRSYRSIK